MKILAIETSCDETAVSKIIATGTVKSPKFKVVANAISTQINIHRPFGGVVPNLAKREHEINLPIILKKLDKMVPYSAKATKGKQKSKLDFLAKDCDMIAVTVGPGLEPALWTGIIFAKKLSKEYKKPLIGVNHLEGHLYSFLLKQKTGITNRELKISKHDNPRPKNQTLKFPAIVLLVSGGHTLLLKLKNMTSWNKLGETVDDAVGEAYDKVARLLELPYPGGPEIEKLAKDGSPTSIDFPRPMLHQKNYNFSFAGLKTAVLYYLRDNPLTANSSKLKANVAASFQKAAVDVLVKKTMRAVEDFNAKSVILCGGVAANKFLRKTMKVESEKIGVQFFSPEFEYNTDNATMIAAAAYMQSKRKSKKLPLKANGNLGI